MSSTAGVSSGAKLRRGHDLHRLFQVPHPKMVLGRGQRKILRRARPETYSSLAVLVT